MGNGVFLVHLFDVEQPPALPSFRPHLCFGLWFDLVLTQDFRLSLRCLMPLWAGFSSCPSLFFHAFLLWAPSII